MKISVDGNGTDCRDLYSPYTQESCVELFSSPVGREVELEIGCLGRNANSHSNQIVFKGIFLRTDEVEAVNLCASPVEPAHLPTAPVVSFEDLQVHMVDRYRNEHRSRPNAVELERLDSYRKRLKEMLVYVRPGQRVLDMGAGYLWPTVFEEVIVASEIEYWAQDVDSRAVEHLRATFAQYGTPVDHAIQGLNTVLSYADSFFDLVFSSHCLEHSENLATTFSELYRIIKPSGYLFFSVPFGYDDSLEHPYALDVNDWRSLATNHGFDVVNQHIGKTYSPERHDVSYVARKLSSASR